MHFRENKIHLWNRSKNISIKSKTLLNALGVTRSEIFGLDLNSNFDLNKIHNLLMNSIDIIFIAL